MIEILAWIITILLLISIILIAPWIVLIIGHYIDWCCDKWYDITHKTKNYNLMSYSDLSGKPYLPPVEERTENENQIKEQ